MLVYKIPYRRAPRLAYRPLGRVRRASKGILHTNCMQDQRYLGFNSFAALTLIASLELGLRLGLGSV